MTEVTYVDNQTGLTDHVIVSSIYEATIMHHLKADGCTILTVVVAK